MAAKQGHVAAQRCYGLSLEAGLAVRRDLPKALYYFKRSVSSGNSRAVADVDRCRRFLNGEEPLPLGDWLRNFDHVGTIRALGIGRTGPVKLVRDERTGQKFALRDFDIMSQIRSELDDLFTRGADMLIRLIHPCVVPIVGFAPAEAERPPRIGMKYAVKGSLRKALAQVDIGERPTCMDDTGIAIIICGVVIGMKFFHSRGAIHRDLKPESILIGKHSRPLIGDLRSSRFFDWTRTLTKQVWTAYYTAPEMYEDGEYTVKVDVFSFAFLLYEILVGRPALSSDLSPHQVMKRVAYGRLPVVPENINSVLRNAISRGWSKEAGERPSFVDILSQLESINYAISRDVDSDKVSAYVAAIHELESFE